jgi:L-fuconate dehydratase
MTTITSVTVTDIRFPTSLSMDGSDAMNKDGDYSAAYVHIVTDDPALAGFGFTFTIGRGNDLCVEAARQRALPLIGREVAEVVGDLGATYRGLQSDSQLRWLGPDKGVIHLALAAVMNAVWDLAARAAGVPLWRLLAEMTPEQLVDAADLRYPPTPSPATRRSRSWPSSRPPARSASASSPRAATPATRPAPAGWGTPTRSCGASVRKPWMPATAT